MYDILTNSEIVSNSNTNGYLNTENQQIVDPVLETNLVIYENTFVESTNLISEEHNGKPI